MSDELSSPGPSYQFFPQPLAYQRLDLPSSIPLKYQLGPSIGITNHSIRGPTPLYFKPRSRCPAGLECLTMLDQVFLKQTRTFVESSTGLESGSTCMVFNRLGQPLYVVEEKPESSMLVCFCWRRKPFEVGVKDILTQVEVIHISRRRFCCREQVAIRCPSAANMLLGTVIKHVTWLAPIFEVLNSQSTPVFKIEGPGSISMMDAGFDIHFKIVSLEGRNATIGNISRQWRGFLPSMYNDEDNFGLYFPIDLDVRMKALLLGVTILINYTLYEDD